MLLVGGGLLLRTFVRAAGDSTSASIPIACSSAGATRRASRIRHASVRSRFYDRLLERASALPGVETAALASVLPLGGDSDMSILDRRTAGADRTMPTTTPVWYRLVSAGYFEAMGIPLKRGRDFRAARSSAVGRRQRDLGAALLAERRSDRPAHALQRGRRRAVVHVVGVAGEVRVRGARGEQPQRDVSALLAVPRARHERRPQDDAAGRNARRAAARRRCAMLDPGIAGVGDHGDVDDGRRTRSTSRASSPCSSALFAAAGAGARGDRHLRRDRRTPSRSGRPRSASGWRSARDGARSSRWSIGDGLRLTALGVLVGVAAAAGVSVSLGSLLFGVTPLDPLTFAAMTAHCSSPRRLLACLLPARRAAQVDPMVALRRNEELQSGQGLYNR